MDLTTRATPYIPVDIINSIQEVITESSPCLAVNRMRVELNEIRDSIDSSVAESQRGLVVDLSEQVMNNSINSTILESRVLEMDLRHRIQLQGERYCEKKY